MSILFKPAGDGNRERQARVRTDRAEEITRPATERATETCADSCMHQDRVEPSMDEPEDWTSDLGFFEGGDGDEPPARDEWPVPGGDYFGNCPVCGSAGIARDIGRSIYIACDEHRICWFIGNPCCELRHALDLDALPVEERACTREPVCREPRSPARVFGD